MRTEILAKLEDVENYCERLPPLISLRGCAGNYEISVNISMKYYIWTQQIK